MPTVLIVGPSGAGKTTTAEILARKVTGMFRYYPKLIDLDNYYLPRSMQFAEEHDWEHPENINWELFEHHVRSAKFDNPMEVTLVTGFIAAYTETIRSYADIIVYISADPGTSIRRRWERSQERRSPQLIDDRYNQNYLVPGIAKYVEPQRDFADYILEAEDWHGDPQKMARAIWGVITPLLQRR